MLECSSVKLLARAAFMYNTNKGHAALMHYAALNGLADSINGEVDSASMLDPIDGLWMDPCMVNTYIMDMRSKQIVQVTCLCNLL